MSTSILVYVYFLHPSFNHTWPERTVWQGKIVSTGKTVYSFPCIEIIIDQCFHVKLQVYIFLSTYMEVFAKVLWGMVFLAILIMSGIVVLHCQLTKQILCPLRSPFIQLLALA